MTPPFQLSRASHPRLGMSVVEVLVALMIVSIGLLGIAGSTALAFRTTMDAERRRDAAQRAASRVAQLSATGCARAADGSTSDPTRQISERWTVAARANGFATVTDSVSWMSARGARSFSLTSAITC
jgi:Tfp pilus assembly protein PilV